MASSGDDRLADLIEQWDSHPDSEALYAELRDPMRRAARRGLRFVLSRTPDEADVDDVVLKAFGEVLPERLEDDQVSSWVRLHGGQPPREGQGACNQS